MNTIDEYIKKVISIRRVNTKTTAGFRIKCLVSTWGGDQVRIFWSTRKDEYVKGYSYQA